MDPFLRIAAALIGVAASSIPATFPPQSTPAALKATGEVTFVSLTNLSAISVEGKSSRLEGQVQALQEEGRLELSDIRIEFPVKSLKTGMGLRDRHMWNQIFKAQDGSLPLVRFEAEKAECSSSGAHQVECPIEGRLSIRGAGRPFSALMKGRTKSAPLRLELEGAAQIRLSDYEIARPSQLGVRVEDEVRVSIKIHATENRTVNAENREG